MDDVLMFRVDGLDEKEPSSPTSAACTSRRRTFGHPAVLVRIPDLARVDRDELRDLVAVAADEGAEACSEGLAPSRA